ncbi:CAP domain-containing protein [Chytriomyces sp. MP71]|nr:CAP domain-containing protein [Chytriomyces sp. MP71]
MRAGKYYLGFAGNGALVASLMNKNYPIVWSNEKMAPSSKPFVLDFNGTISTRTNGKVYWTVDVKGEKVADFCISPDGSIGLYNKKGKRVWSPLKPSCNANVGTSKTTPDGQRARCLTPGQRIDVCESMSAGKFKVTMQNDGNFVLYRKSTMEALWDTGSAGSTTKHFIFQTDGNIVLYDKFGEHIWASNTPDVESTLLCIQPDGNFVAYDGANAVWDSGTTQIITPPTSSAASSSFAPPRTTSMSSSSKVTSASSSLVPSTISTIPSMTSIPQKTTSTVTPGLTADEMAALNEHNLFRAKNGMPSLSYNKTTEARANEYAIKLAANGCQLVHGDDDGLGQNLAMVGGAAQSIVYLIQLWETEAIQPSTGLYNHATQMLWKSTTAIGCSVAAGSTPQYPCQVLVCDYYPPGNYFGRTWKSG